MCGIVGVIAAYSNGMTMDEAKAFRDMVVVDSLRGFDSTGVFSISNKGNMDMLKAAVTGAEFVTTKEYQAFSTDNIMRGMFMVGHNRAATRGTVNDVNAHPFCVNDNIILVQNGTYNGSHHHHKNTEVDTEAIAWVLDEHPKDIQGALQKIDAAYCLVWYNMTDQALYIIRNGQRPLFMANTDNGGIMYASEQETIMLAASRQSIKLKGVPFLIAQDTLFKWQLHPSSKTHSFSQVKLDNTFRQTHRPHSQAWSRHNSHYSMFGFESEIEVEQPTPIHNVKPRTSPHLTDITIHTHVYNAEFTSSMMTNEQEQELRRDLDMRSRDARLYVEFNSYLPAKDNSTGKTSWYITGAPIMTGEYPMPVTYSIVFDKTEEEVYAMIDEKKLYSVTVPGTPIAHTVKDERGVSGRIVTLFVANLVEVENAETTQ